MSCPDCFKGSVHTHADPVGSIAPLHGVSTYITGAPDAKSTILYLPDAFGLKLVNNKLLADAYAAGTGSRVLIPDLLWRGGADPSQMDTVDKLLTPGGGFLAKLWYFVQVAPGIIPFTILGAAPKAYPDILKFARAVRAELPAGGKLGVAGFCWGGYGSTMLCAEKAVEGGEAKLVDVQFTGHPSYVTPEMILAAVEAKVPYSCAVAEYDGRFTVKVAEEVEAKLKEKVGTPEEGGYEFVTYKQCIHGFAVRAAEGTPNMEGYHKAVKQAVDWFNKYLS